MGFDGEKYGYLGQRHLESKEESELMMCYFMARGGILV